MLEKAGVEFDVNPDGEDASFLSRANICPADGTALAITGWHEIAEELGLF
ncbi:MAG: hypothetical protein BWY65_02397 [Firmicutes bacterium ADurb.Bin373]|nr:MAG: hypothetical protein BWY65_02397 [Firmicutes bacterium ADurb.Bin373]